MNHQRRTILKAASLAPSVAGGVGLAHAATAAVSASQSVAIAGVTLLRGHFSPLEGEGFAFGRPGEGAPSGIATLLQATALPGVDDGDRSFRLVFAPVQPLMLAQGTWEVSHPVLGRHAIFVSPNDAAGREVEAVFNRHLPL